MAGGVAVFLIIPMRKGVPVLQDEEEEEEKWNESTS